MHLDDARPIWVQLAEDFRMRITSGRWAAGTKIPSVRELAMEAGANPNTIQRALGELDREGLTAAERTSGRFVTSDADTIETARYTLARTAADIYIGAVIAVGLGLEDATNTLQEQWHARDVAHDRADSAPGRARSSEAPGLARSSEVARANATAAAPETGTQSASRIQSAAGTQSASDGAQATVDSIAPDTSDRKTRSQQKGDA